MSDPYDHPKHTVHIITGLGGCDFLSVCGQQKNVPGSAVVIENDIGYLVINTLNTTHIRKLGI